MKKTFVLSAIALACLPAQAEIFQLGQIEIVANQSNNNSVAQIDAEQLQQNNAVRVTDIGKFTPGVSFERSGGRNELNVRVRGFDSRRVPIYVDGIPVYVPYDGNMDLGRFTTFDLARVDVSKGASSVLYGANTLGGAINLISKKPSKAFEGTIGYGYSKGRDADTATNQAYFNLGTKQELFYAQLSGSWVEQQGLQLSRHFEPTAKGYEDGGRAENSVQRDKKLSLKVAFTPNATDEYALVLSTQKGAKQSPLYEDKTNRFWRWPAWDKDSIYFLSHTQFASHNMYLNTKVFYDTFKNDLTFYKDHTFAEVDTSSKGGYSHYRDYTIGAGLEFGGDLTDADTLKFSAIYKNDVHREQNEKYDNKAKAFVGEPWAVDKDRTWSFGLENTYKFSEQTKFIAGISYDYRKALRAENYQSNCPGYPAKQDVVCGFDVGNQHAFNYQLKLAHSFDKNDELTVGFAKTSRLPTMKDRYSRRFGRNDPNPFLNAETAYHYEVGYWRTFADKLKVEGALFYSEVRDAIESVYLRSETVKGKKNDVYQNQNYGKEVFKGLELGATLFATEDLTIGANYTYTHAKNKTYQTPVTNVPKHKFFAYVDWQVVNNLNLFVSQQVEKGRYYQDGDAYTTIPSFGVTNMKVTYHFTPEFSVDAGVNNLFDRNYYYAEGYPEQGRVYFGNLKYSF